MGWFRSSAWGYSDFRKENTTAFQGIAGGLSKRSKRHWPMVQAARFSRCLVALVQSIILSLERCAFAQLQVNHDIKKHDFSYTRSNHETRRRCFAACPWRLGCQVLAGPRACAGQCGPMGCCALSGAGH